MVVLQLPKLATRVRFPLPAVNIFRLIAILLYCVLCSGCATAPTISPAEAPPPHSLPALQGSYHTVRRSETLWRIAHSYGLGVNALAAANHLTGAVPLKTGQQLFIPLPVESQRFLWPVRGSLRSPSNDGIDIAATAGSLVRASRSGRVAIAAHQLSGLGKTVVVDHLDGYVSIYASLEQILVSPGASLRQGMPLGLVGSRRRWRVDDEAIGS